LKKEGPKKSLKPNRLEKDVILPVLMTDKDQNTIFFITPQEGFSAEITSLFSHKEHFNMTGGLQQLIKGEQIDDFIILACRVTGIHVFKIEGKTLTHIQRIHKGS
jgi:hypothetical protein